MSDPVLMWVSDKIPREIPGPRGGSSNCGVLSAGAILQQVLCIVADKALPP